MSQHDTADHVANGVNIFISGALVFIHNNISAIIDFDLGVFQAEITGIRLPADSHQHAVERLPGILALAAEHHLDPILLLFKLFHLGVEMDALKQILQHFLQRFDQVTVGPRH